MADLPCTDRVLTETMRLYPPVWMVTRRVTVRTELGGHVLTAGTDVLISPYLLQRRADMFADPDTFNPDREISPLGAPHGAFAAFGGGSRKCIGERFARVEAALFLAVLLARWRIVPVTGPRYRAARSLTLAPRGLRVRLVAR